MLKLIEVYSPPAGFDYTRHLLASLDVTENTTDDRLRILQALREIYPAPEHSYFLHDCGHDEGNTCTREVA